MYLLDEVLHTSIPELQKQRLKPVCVAVLDSGIDATHELLRKKVHQAWEFYEENGEVVKRELPLNSNNDDAGHGTAVGSIITRMAPNARILDFKVLNSRFAGSGKVMLKGLEAAIESEAVIINMSLACLKKYRDEISALCEKAYQKHKIIIASKRNVVMTDDMGFPAELSSCISVENKSYSSPFFVDHIDEQPIEFAAHGENVLVAQNGGGYYRLTGTSYATPTVSGVTALLLGKYPDLELFEIKSILKYHSQKQSFFKLAGAHPLEVAWHTQRSHRNSSGYTCPHCHHFMRVHEAFSAICCPKCKHLFSVVSGLDKKLYREICSRLQNYLPGSYTYHNKNHTQEVVANTWQFIQHYPSLSAKEKKCLMTAALLHDCGFLESYSDNEKLAAALAEKILPDYDYKPDEIKLIQSLIMATAMPVSPRNLLEKILCDADVAHIGIEVFWKKSRQLLNERRQQGCNFSEEEYIAAEIDFLKQHRYFQRWLEKERKSGREAIIKELQSKLCCEKL